MKQTFISKKLFGIRHDYDLENPIIKTVSENTITGYQCNICGNRLWLNLNQMKNLPKTMKYGCKIPIRELLTI